MDGPKKYLNKIANLTSTTVTRYIWIIVLLAIIGVWIYYKIQIGKLEGAWKKMKAEYSNDIYASKIAGINNIDPKFKDKLFSYYIASSYNSCCAGDFQNSYVSVEPLKQIISHGARVLDFAIYSIDGTAVVAAGPDNSATLKGTYNSIPIDEVLSNVSNLPSYLSI